jgi:hypothetical protein
MAAAAAAAILASSFSVSMVLASPAQACTNYQRGGGSLTCLDPETGCGWATGMDYAKCISGFGPQTPEQLRNKQAEDACWANPPGDPAYACPKQGSWKN